MNFKQKYNKVEFIKFLNNFLPNDFNISSKDILIDTRRYKAIKKAEIIGISKSLENLYIIECLHNKNNDPRITITTDAFKIMADHRIRKALIIFYNNDTNNYRLSFLKISLDIDENNKISKKFTDAKRLSFYLGENAKIRTPETQLFEKGQVQSLDDLESRFSIEVVNKQFYLEIAKLFDKFLYSKELEIKFPTEDEGIQKNFIVRLLGRIIFCWFLKQKNGDKGPLIPESILSSQALIPDYYHKTIEPLFFEILNSPIGERKIRNEEFDKVPYLNGGLFQPQLEDYYNLNQDTFKSDFHDQLKIDNEWFVELFKLLETYNFTIDENTSQDQELSIDPEMLGRIFENLLAELNERKKTGSFYTPREIVDYMVDASLLEYFSINSGVDRIKLSSLLSYDLEDDLQNPIDTNERYNLIQLVDSLKILDPACGSGAFPIGLLQKLVFITNQLDPDGSLWLNLKLKSVPDLYKNKIIEEFKNKPLEYIRKLDIIKNTIHGVDIQPIAVDVSRLRCFLTLIVEAKVDDSNPNNRGIEALPNLDFKFVSADALTPSPDKFEYVSGELFSTNDYVTKDDFETQFINSVDKYFGSTGNSKNNAKDAIYKLVIQKIKEKMDSITNSKTYLKTEKRFDFNKEYEKKNIKIIEVQSKLTHLWESYLNIFNNKTVEFFDTKYFFPSVKDGFDIVIGNPPYVQLQKDGGYLAKKYQNYDFKTFSRTGDLYCLFYEKGIELLKNRTGILTFITSNKWMRASYGEKLRDLFVKKNPKVLIDLGGGVFESATVDSNIIIIENSENEHNTSAITLKKNKFKLLNLTENNQNYISFNNKSAWYIGNKLEIDLKNKIENLGKPIKQLDIKINYGLKTGLNEAFFISEVQKEKLISIDPKNSNVIKPIIMGRDIKKYWFEFNHKWVIISKYEFHNELINDYPAIYNHLKNFEIKLKNRGQCKYNRGQSKTSGQHHWLELDNNPKDEYLNLFSKDKICWGNISYNNSFAKVNSGVYITAPANFITSDNIDLDYLLGVLNSKIFNWEFKQIGIFLGDAYEWKKLYVEQVHIPVITDNNRYLAEEISNIVKQINFLKLEDKNADISDLEDLINKKVYKMYNLTESEINLIEN